MDGERKPISDKMRFEILKRDWFKCQYCGTPVTETTLVPDHVIPVAKGGTNDLWNLVAACVPCNSGKSGNLLNDLEWLRVRWRERFTLPWEKSVQADQAKQVTLLMKLCKHRGYFPPDFDRQSLLEKCVRAIGFKETHYLLEQWLEHEGHLGDDGCNILDWIDDGAALSVHFTERWIGETCGVTEKTATPWTVELFSDE